MKRSTFLLSVFLIASVAVNGLLLFRLSGARPSATPAAEEEKNRLLAEIGRLRLENGELRERANRIGAPGPRPAPVPTVSATVTPGDFWTELERLHASNDFVDDSLHLHRMVNATADYLELVEPERSRFAGMARAVHLSVVQAEVERQQARIAGEPAEDVDRRYREKIDAAADQLRSSLDPTRKRNETFCIELARWFRYFRIPGR